MKFRVDNKVSIVLILVAGASLVSMLATLRIDSIVHHDLYDYGLQFSRQWAVPYWTMAAVVFSMGWLIILTSVAFELRLVMNSLHRPFETETPTPRQEAVQNEGPITSENIRVIARNTGTKPVTINELWINNVKQTSVTPALPYTIKANDETLFAAATIVRPGCRYQVRLVSTRDNASVYMGTTRARETPKMEAEATRGAVEKRMMRTAVAVKNQEDDVSEFRVLPEESSVVTSATGAHRKAKDKPRNE